MIVVTRIGLYETAHLSILHYSTKGHDFDCKFYTLAPKV